jgi:hypothetical protein
MKPFDSTQEWSRCAVCGRAIASLPLLWISEYGGYICDECIRSKFMNVKSESQRMKDALLKIKGLIEFSQKLYGSNTENYNLILEILEYAEEGLEGVYG